MEIKRACEILHEHNKWRRGESEYEIRPKLIGEAIDTVLEELREKQEDEATWDNMRKYVDHAIQREVGIIKDRLMWMAIFAAFLFYVAFFL